MKLPESVHESLLADQLRAYERQGLLDTVLPADAFVGIDHGKGSDLSAAVFAHMEGPVMVVDSILYYCPDHGFTPPDPIEKPTLQETTP